MKHFTTLIVSLFLSLAPLSIKAQSKVAHINTQQLISEMPEVIAAQNELTIRVVKCFISVVMLIV